MVLADDALGQVGLHFDQSFHVAFEHLRDRDARPFRDHFGHILLVDLFLEHLLCLLDLRQFPAQSFQLLPRLDQFSVADFGDLFQLAAPLGILLFDLQRILPFLEFFGGVD